MCVCVCCCMCQVLAGKGRKRDWLFRALVERFVRTVMHAESEKAEKKMPDVVCHSYHLCLAFRARQKFYVREL